ncbi:MAG: hypothetical protein IV094_02945 [Vitreoscilla sp.]|nr:hypothetical protein [Vitreoscilla sp.]
MSRLWLYLVPQLKDLPEAERARVLKDARKGRHTSGEALVLVGWMVAVYFFVQEVIAGSTHESKLAFAIAANLVVALPLILLVWIPLHLRMAKRNIRLELAKRGERGA